MQHKSNQRKPNLLNPTKFYEKVILKMLKLLKGYKEAKQCNVCGKLMNRIIKPVLKTKYY